MKTTAWLACPNGRNRGDEVQYATCSLLHSRVNPACTAALSSSNPAANRRRSASSLAATCAIQASSLAPYRSRAIVENACASA